MKLNIHLVTWNGSKYIPYLFESLRKQTFKDFKLIILDNASSDDTVEKIKKELSNVPFEYELILNKENKGFAGGHGQLWSQELGIRNQEVDYVLLLNQDMYLTANCIEKMFKFMNENPETAVVSPRLMKWDFNKMQNIQDSFTNQIDTLGLKVLRSRRVIEKYAGKNWDEVRPKVELSHHTKNEAMEVFGVSGALPMFRISIINKVGLFDESFGSYKEDVDLAYRLRLTGYKSFVLLNSIAFHDRSAAGVDRKGDRVAIENKKKQSRWVKYNSYRNHLITLIKNEYWQNFLLDLPWIKWYEFKKFVYFLMFDRQVLKGLKEIWQMRKELKTKRLKIKEMRRINWKELRKWWSN